ncbi:MAG: hypothetical protein GX638_15525, partial [Crenarchaeota archaeon]|nr:hypothetical protein [Thermoproteota archaeon]
DVGYVIASLLRIPVSLIICLGTIFLIIVYWISLKTKFSVNGDRKSITQMAKEINWDIILFMLCIFIVVKGLEPAGVVDALSSLLLSSSALPSVLGIFIPSMIITIGASFMNNWPMTILGLFSIEKLVELVGLNGPILTGLIFSNVIGNNLGPHFFPLGSLAILMWLDCMRRRGVKISLREYLKVGAVLSIVEVGVASSILWIQINLGFTLGL